MLAYLWIKPLHGIKGEFMYIWLICIRLAMYSITGKFGRVNVWRIAELKVVDKKKFGEWIDFLTIEIPIIS